MNSSTLSNRPSRPMCFGAALAVSGLGLVAGTAEATAPPSSDSIQLPVPYEVGQSAQHRTVYSMDISMMGQELGISTELVSSDSVVSVEPDGSAVVESVVDELTIDDGGLGVDTSGMDDLIGIRIQTQYAANGEPGESEIVNADELTDSQLTAARDVADQSSVPFSFPDTPVAVGDTWTSIEPLELETGGTIEAEYHYELTALDDTSFEIAITYGQPIDVDVDGTQATGEVSGEGTVTGDRANPLALEFTFSQFLELEMDGMSAELQIDVSQTNVG